MKALYDSFVRTIVPIIVGAVVGWFTASNIDLDPDFEVSLVAVITGAASALYYVLVRLVEQYVSPKFGWLLGSAKTPLYASEWDSIPVLDTETDAEFDVYVPAHKLTE